MSHFSIPDYKLQIAFEEQVEHFRNGLANAEDDLRRLNARPPRCRCNPREWRGEVGPVCDHFELAERCNRCRHCEHPAECHEVKP